MNTCATCGHVNEPGAAFCGSCSAFLEWSDPAVAPAPVVAHAGPAGGQNAGATAEPDRAVVPAARAPEPEQPRLAPSRGPSETTTDLYCGDCGSGNAEGRRYCRNCGQPLADVAAVEPQHPRWWSRLWSWITRPVRHRRKRTLSAGERPEPWARTQPADRRRRFHLPTRVGIGKLALPLCILSLFGLGLGPLRVQIVQHGYAVVHKVQRTVSPDYVTVSAQRATASSSIRGHRAGAGIDQDAATWWGAEPAATGVHLDVRYAGSVDVRKVAFHSGAQGKGFAKFSRPRKVRLVLSGKGAVTVTRELELEDRPELQTFDVEAHHVSTVSLQIVTVYPGQASSATAISEFQLVKVK